MVHVYKLTLFTYCQLAITKQKEKFFCIVVESLIEKYALVVMNYQGFGKSKWSIVCRLAKWASKLSIVTCRVASLTGDPCFIYIVAVLIAMLDVTTEMQGFYQSR